MNKIIDLKKNKIHTTYSIILNAIGKAGDVLRIYVKFIPAERNWCEYIYVKKSNINNGKTTQNRLIHTNVCVPARARKYTRNERVFAFQRRSTPFTMYRG